VHCRLFFSVSMRVKIHFIFSDNVRTFCLDCIGTDAKKNAKFTHNDLQSLGLMVGPLSILVTESLPYNLCFFPLSIDLIF
jgi:hypothetical protein